MEENYLIGGKTVYLRRFYGEASEVLNFLGEEGLKNVILDGVTKIVWGKEGEHWCLLSDVTDPMEEEFALGEDFPLDYEEIESLG